MTNAAILWRRLDQPGHEAARLSTQDGFWRLAGTANFIYNGQPCRLDYRILCDKTWQTRSGRVAGWVGPEPVEVDIAVDVAGRWWLNGTEITAVADCLDLDLNFSPSTNLLPIRRLGLAVGQAALVKAAWLRFPSFTLEPLEQTYHRLAETTYRYESAGGKFVSDLPVNAAGFVTTYPDFWELEAMT